MAGDESLLNESQAGVEFNLADLRAPGVFTHPVHRIELRETMLSRIVLTGPFAYKIKKAVRLDFIDSSTLALRRELCAEELRLNRRLAPDLYCDVVPITRSDTGQLCFGGAGPAIEYAVRMRQFDATQELHALLDANQISAVEVRGLAKLLAAFHDRAEMAPEGSVYGGYEQVRSTLLDNLTTLLAHIPPGEKLPELDRLCDWTWQQLHTLERVFDTRKANGAVREGHGDLHARNIVRWQGVLTPFDCLEFEPNLRWIDVINDVAFLVMDLAAQQRSDLAFAFCSEYLECSGDYDGVRLLRLFAVYRALVRAKVDALAAGSVIDRHEFRERLRARIHSAAAWLDQPAPILIVMHGVSGSGKSWLSERLAPQLSALRVRSDLERKRLAGGAHGPSSGYRQGMYAAAVSHRTYARLLDCAESCLQGGISVIVDAAFLEEQQRRLFHDLALRMGLRYFVLSCAAPPPLLQQRIEARRRAASDVSDADLAILRRQLAAQQPFAPYEQKHMVCVNTADHDALRVALAVLQQRLARSDAVTHADR